MKSNSLYKIAAMAGIVFNLFLQPVYAAEHQRPEREGKPFAPPQEAVAACNGLAENDACSFTGRNSENLKGVCSLPPHSSENASLACRPDRSPEGGNMEPPPNRQD